MYKTGEKIKKVTISFLGFGEDPLKSVLILNSVFLKMGHFLKKSGAGRFTQEFRRKLAKDVNRSNTQSTQLSENITLIRSPFVHKKTREQFRFKKKSLVVRLYMAKVELEMLIQLLSITKFPAEFKVNVIS